MIRDVRAVFFDVGGPIYDDENFVRAVLVALDELRAQREQSPVDRVKFRNVYDRHRQQQSGSLRRKLSVEFLGGEEDRDVLHTRTSAYWVHPAGTIHGDLIPCLEALHGKVRIGVLANQEASVVDALNRDGVSRFIDIWGISGVVGLEKPDPAFFEWAVAQAGVRADQAVHIGNRLDTDVRPAKALGLGTVWVLRGEAPEHPTRAQLDEPDLAVTSLSSVPDAVFRLQRR